MKVKIEQAIALTREDVDSGQEHFEQMLESDGATATAAMVQSMSARAFCLLVSPHRDGMYEVNVRASLALLLAYARAYNQYTILSVVEEMIVDA